MLNYALTRGFQEPYLLDRGPASAILHFGPKVTGVIRAELAFETNAGTNFYRFTLADSANDRLTFTKEEVQLKRRDMGRASAPVPLIQHPSDNSGLCELWAENDATARFAKGFLQRCRVYQFLDTSLTSHLRDYSCCWQTWMPWNVYFTGTNRGFSNCDQRSQLSLMPKTSIMVPLPIRQPDWRLR